MRYENWDVLLFPESCKVPVQEFKTQCFVTKDTESPYLQISASMSPPSYYPAQGNVGQVPVLTTFIPSMPKDSSFRVSIHSWDKPRPSRFMEKLMEPEDVLVFEGRVFIDGQLVAGGIFGQRAIWPYVIDIDRDGNQDVLRFPPFHPEILDQQHWDAGDPFGRVKVIISEGFARPDRSPPFERVKDVITLSFQHAPLSILEYSNIAWPNSNMWTQALRVGPKFDSTGKVGGAGPDDTPHGHSPSRPEPRLPQTISNESSSTQSGASNVWASNAWVSNRAFPFPVPQWDRQGHERRWGFYPDRYFEPLTTEQVIEPLITDDVWNHRGARSSREDVPMPDYSSIASSRAMSSVAGMSYGHSKQASMTTPGDDDQINELIQAMTPTKVPPTTGTRAPSNTPSTLPATAKSSVVVEVRHGSTRTSALRELSQPSTRDVSGSSNKSLPVEQVTTPSRLAHSPSGSINGKKEWAKENSKESSQKSSGEDVIEDPKENKTLLEKKVDCEKAVEVGEGLTSVSL
ncbi:hypothetical protein N7507_005506 [Penicillium longicatenatum]|nr:hypothetical protein N7507_005506 [Penicillium longicatenatum]